MRNQLPKNRVDLLCSTSELINSDNFSGNEIVIFVLEVQHDVYSEPVRDLDPVDEFFEKSSFADALKSIICNNEIFLEGSILRLKEEMILWGDLSDIRKNLFDNDYSDIIEINSFEAVPGIYSVNAKITGESNVDSMRNLNVSTLDSLNISVITEFLIVTSKNGSKL